MARQRIVALDGIRGFAIFLVIINHLSYTSNLSHLKGFPKFMWNTLLLNGPFGVNIFFILCGFLMAYLYPQIKFPMNFIAKRYMRIFPLFFTVCTFNLIIFINKNLPPWIQLVSLILIGTFVHTIWIKGIEQKNYSQIVLNCVKAFIALQIVMAVINVAVGRLEAAQFDTLFATLKYSTIYLANLTLTLWAGWNIPIMSGPYWSLAPEILFYLVYPLMLFSIISKIKKFTWMRMILLLVISSLLLLIINEIFNHILALSRLNIVRSYAFVVGIMVALVLQDKRWESTAKVLKRKGIQILTITLVPVFLVLFPFFPESNQLNLNLFHLISNSLLLIVFLATLVEGTWLNTFFSSKWLLFLGLISYPAYLIHSVTIGWLNSFVEVTNQLSMFLYAIGALIITVPIAFLLHYLVERPYFNNPKAHNFPVK